MLVLEKLVFGIGALLVWLILLFALYVFEIAVLRVPRETVMSPGVVRFFNFLVPGLIAGILCRWLWKKLTYANRGSGGSGTIPLK